MAYCQAAMHMQVDSCQQTDDRALELEAQLDTQRQQSRALKLRIMELQVGGLLDWRCVCWPIEVARAGRNERPASSTAGLLVFNASLLAVCGCPRSAECRLTNECYPACCTCLKPIISVPEADSIAACSMMSKACSSRCTLLQLMMVGWTHRPLQQSLELASCRLSSDLTLPACQLPQFHVRLSAAAPAGGARGHLGSWLNPGAKGCLQKQWLAKGRRPGGASLTFQITYFQNSTAAPSLHGGLQDHLQRATEVSRALEGRLRAEGRGEMQAHIAALEAERGELRADLQAMAAHMADWR